ncbi:hypothetical protein ABSL23_13200 [Halobacterium sp. NMX12-1]|uniref:Uncharacterized protein n=1 Tax=Halobacterium sp. NMX12-1 TaxID=3166650 RepID=A0AAU8CBV0_9EURY
MSGIDPSPDTSNNAYSDATSFDDLDKSVQAEALARAIRLLASDGYPPFTADELSEALEPEQLKVIANEIEIVQELSEEQIQTLAETIPRDDVEETVQPEMETNQSPSQTPEELQEIRQAGVVIATSLVLTLIGITGAWYGISTGAAPVIMLSAFMVALVMYKLLRWSWSEVNV